jgi:hypothetical protein
MGDQRCGGMHGCGLRSPLLMLQMVMVKVAAAAAA